MARSLSLIIPAYNEVARLPDTLKKLALCMAELPVSCEVIVVDNNSSDGTAAVTRQAMPAFPQLRLLRTASRGKGLAVRAGIFGASGEVLIFADADMSWALADLLRVHELVSQAHAVVIGSRESHGAVRVAEPGHRHVMGRVFNRLVQTLLVPGIDDTQCGLKAFSREAARAIFSRCTIDGFGFDVEVLLLARLLGYGVLEVPIEWHHSQDSRVQPVADSFIMFRDLLRIRTKLLFGRYMNEDPEMVARAARPELL